MMKPKSTPKSRAMARSKAKQGDQAKFTKSQLARPGKVSESGTWQVAAIKAGTQIIKNLTTPKAGTPRLLGSPAPRPPGAKPIKPKTKTSMAGTPARLGVAAVRPRPAAPAKPGPSSKPAAGKSATSSAKWSPSKGVHGTTGTSGRKPATGKKPAPPRWSSKTRSKGK